MNYKTIDSTEIFFHDILEQLKTDIHTNVKTITFMFMSSLRDKFMRLLQNTAADVSVFFRLPCWYPSGWAPAWRPHKPLLITFPSDSSYTKYSSDLNLGEGLSNSTSFHCTDSVLWNGLDFYVDLF